MSDKKTYQSGERMKKLTGIFQRPSTNEMLIIWDGEIKGSIDMYALSRLGEYAEYAWENLYTQVKLKDLFLSSPELTLEFYKNSSGTQQVK